MNTWQGQVFKLYAVIGPGAYWYPAPFGRYGTRSALSMNGKLAWVVSELVAPLTFLYYLISSYTRTESRISAWQLLPAVLFVLHYVNRSLIWPLLMMPAMSPSHVMVFTSATVWQYLNGFLQANAVLRMTTPGSTRGFLGSLIFLTGMVGNIWHDNKLANLRKQSKDRSASTEYYIPHGGLFEYVSFPNYFCEWIEWTGYALILDQPAGYWFVMLEILVMAPRALTGHIWYKEKFGDKFPSSRKAFLPWVW